MNRFCLTAVLWMICALPGIAVGDENPWAKKLPFESATLHYVLSGTQQGTEDLYIRDFGRETATHRKATTTMMGMKMDTATVEIQDSEWKYFYDLNEKTGSKMVNPQKFMVDEYNKLTAAEKKQVQKNAEVMGTSVMKGMNGKMEQKVTKILGYDCDRTTFMGSTVYMLHGAPIPLKSEMDMAGMKMSSVATSLKEGEADDTFFQHPADIEAVHNQESDEMSKTMAVQVISMLKDPEAAKKMSQGQSAAPGQMMKGLLGN